MPSEIWTLSGPASGTLADLGIVDASILFTGQARDTCELTFDDPDHAAAFWATGGNVTLSRSGTAFFRGKVAADVRSGSPDRDARRVPVEGVWAQLERLPYSQDWKHWNGSAVVTQAEHPRVICGRSGSGPYTDTAAALGAVITYAAAHGVAIAAGETPTTKLVPLIETHGRSCADILRQILRYHPECGVWIGHSTSPVTFNVADPGDLASITIDGSDHPLADFQIANQSSEVPSNVILSYECLAEDGDYDGNGTRYRRQIHRDTAGGSSIVPGTLLVSMPALLPEPVQISPREQEMVTTAIPDYDATDAAAERFWIRHSPLERWGIGVNDIALPTATAGDIKAHGKMAVPLPDEDDLEEGQELPAFWSETIGELSREIRVGQIHEWMNRSYGLVRCRVTIAIRKTAVDALGADDLAEALRLCRAETTTIGGFEAYLLDQEVTVAATDALSRVYRENVIAIDTLPDVANQTIPGLAQAYYDLASAPRWEGTIRLTHEEAGATAYMGSVINISHAARTEWATMAARVQSVAIDLAAGVTRLSIGTPDHLSLHDLADLMRLARAPTERAGHTFAGHYDPEDTEAPAWNDGTNPRVAGAAAGAYANRETLSGSSAETAKRWSVYMGNETAAYCRVGRLYMGGNGTLGNITNGNASFSITAPGALWLQTGNTSMGNLTLQAGASPSDLYTFDGNGTMTAYKFILGDFSTSDPGVAGLSLGNATGGNTTVWYRPRVPDTDLMGTSCVVATSGGNAAFGVEFIPW